MRPPLPIEVHSTALRQRWHRWRHLPIRRRLTFTANHRAHMRGCREWYMRKLPTLTAD